MSDLLSEGWEGGIWVELIQVKFAVRVEVGEVDREGMMGMGSGSLIGRRMVDRMRVRIIWITTGRRDRTLMRMKIGHTQMLP